MKGYELSVRCCLLTDIKYRDVYESLGKFINFVMEKDFKLQRLHNATGMKGYSFGSLTPYEKDTYKEGEFYDFKLRSLSLNIIERFRCSLVNSENDEMVITDVSFREIEIYSKIKKLYTVTPTVIMMHDVQKSRYWVNGMDVADVKTAIVNNLTRKYNYLNDTNIRIPVDDIVETVEVTTRKPMVVNYNSKKSRILGFRVNIGFKENKLAQELAAIGYFLGVCTKNSSLGCGFSSAGFGGKA